MSDLLESFWLKHRDSIEVIFLGSFLSACSHLLRILGTSTAIQSSSSAKLFEISEEIFFQVDSILSVVRSVVFTAAIFTNLWAVYCSAMNDDLYLSIRLMVTGENVNRLIITIIQAMITLCFLFNGNGTLFFGCATNSFFGWLQNHGNDLLLVNYACQFVISISRFLAISFAGLSSQYTSKWPFGQLLLCYLFGGLVWCTTLVKTIELSTVLTTWILGFMLAFDWLILRKVQRLKKEDKVARAEKRLVIQMICCSTIYFTFYVLGNLLILIQSPFFGNLFQFACRSVLQTISMGLYTLGQSVLSAIFLKKKRRLPSVQPSQSTTPIPPIFSIRSN